jgi:hypothetical protein
MNAAVSARRLLAVTLPVAFAACGVFAQAQAVFPVGAPGTFVPGTTLPAAPRLVIEDSKTSQVPELLRPVGHGVMVNDAKVNGAVSDDASHQGIKLHGHWIIDVKNPDGTLAAHRDFQNALQFDGEQLLLGLLSGDAVAGGYEVFFTSPTGQTSPCTSGQYPFCVIVQSTTASPGVFGCANYYCVTGLTLTSTFGAGASMKLAGNLTAPGAGVIGSVGTGFNACGSQAAPVTNISPATCASATTGALGGTMTLANITPISVVAGQIIQITVTFTFS